MLVFTYWFHEMIFLCHLGKTLGSDAIELRGRPKVKVHEGVVQNFKLLKVGAYKC